jgi:hypothetical protein
VVDGSFEPSLQPVEEREPHQQGKKGVLLAPGGERLEPPGERQDVGLVRMQLLVGEMRDLG